MPIKKVFVDLVSFLEENKTKKVSSILAEVIELTSAKSTGNTMGSTTRRNEANEVTHIFCYYHKMWEPVSEVEFGAKRTSSTGLNNMCKEGTANYGKQQRVASKARDGITQLAIDGTSAEELQSMSGSIEEARTAIVPREDGIGSPD